MTNCTRWLSIGLIAAGFAGGGFGQNVKSAPPASEQAWQTLEIQVTGGSSLSATDLLQSADAAKAYYTQNPQSGHAAEAREQEILLLIQAAEKGDATQSSRLTSLVQTFRADASVPLHMRFVAASRLNELAIEQTSNLTHAKRLAAYAQSAKAMIAEFPQEPAPYRALLALARDEPDAAAATTQVNTLLALPDLPADVRDGAQTLLARLALIGKPVSGAFTDAVGQTHSLDQLQGKVVLLYTWSATNPGSLLLAARLKAFASAQVALVGLNLDTDVAAAEAAAAKNQLDPLQGYDAAGPAGALAQKLVLDRPGQVYLIDSQGILRDLQALAGLTQKLKTLLPGGKG